MSSISNLRKSLACVLTCSLFISGLLTLTTRPSRASNNSLMRSLTPTVNDPSEKTGPQTKTVDDETRARVHEAYGKLSLSFEANQGQFDRQAQFIARGGGYSLFLSPSEAVMVLNRPVARKDRAQRAASPSALQPAQSMRVQRESRGAKATGRTKDEQAAAPQSAVLRMKLEGANAEAEAEGLDELPGRTNYFVGNDPRKWRTDIPSYARVMYRDVYPGVDLIYYGRQRQLEYDFVIAPGVDPDNIRLNFEGAQSIEVDAQEGDLLLRTEAGDVRLRKPVVYQVVDDGTKREIRSRYEMKDQQRVGFHVDAYDASKPLVIDPILIYSTYLGGSAEEIGTGIAVDAAGNAYVAGATFSSDFPVVNPVQVNTGSNAFVSKLNQDGSALIYSTYIGGTLYQEFSAISIAIDTEGSAYITGSTSSTDFPLVNAVQAIPGGGSDPFVTKLNPQGSALVYSTYLGGSRDEEGRGIVVDAAGNAHVAGLTYSKDFAVVNPFQSQKAGHQAFKSANGGSSWSVSDSGLDAARMHDLVIDPAHPSTLYSSTEQGVFKSTNGGSAWRAVNTGIENTHFSFLGGRLAINPSDTSTIFLGADEGLFKSTNGGDTWVNSLPTVYDEAIVIDPINTSTVYTSAYDPVDGIYGSIFKSTNGGVNWNTNPIFDEYGNGVDVSALEIDPTETSTLYAGSWNGGVFKSTDGGSSWESITTGLPFYQGAVRDFAIDPSNPSIIFAGTQGSISGYDGAGVYKSTDGGHNWQDANDGLPVAGSATIISSLAMDPTHPSVIYAGTGDFGLFKTTDGGAHWSAVNAGMTASTIIEGVVIDPTNTSKVYVATSSLADAFVTKLSPSGSTRIYSTYLGGSEHDEAMGMALDSGGNVYLTGWTGSSNFPVKNPLQNFNSARTFNAAFVTKLSASGSSLAYSTYLGGDNYEAGMSIAVDPSSNAYVAGWTASSNFPVSPAAFQKVRKGHVDTFVTKINPAGSNIVYSTYLGGSEVENPYGIAVNSSGQVCITGWTYSLDFPLVNAIQGTDPEFHYDAFVTRFNAAGSSLLFSTYLGGTSNSFGEDIAVDSANNIYVIGVTGSTDFPTTTNAFQREMRGYGAAFITKIGEPPASILISGSVLRNGAGLAGTTVTLKNGAGSVIRTATTPGDGSYSFNAPGGGDYTVTPSKPDYNFVPPRFNYNNVGTDLPMQNFEAVPAIVRISGKVLRSGAGMTGVTVTLKNKAGDTLQTATTPGDGSYSFNVSGGGDYTVTPSKPDYRFEPPSLSYTKIAADMPTQNFEAVQSIITIQAQIQGINGNGTQGVKVVLRGSRIATCITGSNGLCVFTGLPALGNYTVTPTKTGTTFLPVFKTFNSPASDQVVTFKEAFSLSGRVTGFGGIGIGGVTIRVSGDSVMSRTTDNQGNYKFTGLPAGGHYVVTPSKTGMTFNPALVEINNLNAPTTAGFQALVSITGKVKRTGTTSGISGVTMTLTGSLSTTTTTNSGGIYTFSNLPAAGNYTVTPSKTGYTFNPPSRTSNNLRVSKGLSSSYFDGTP